jgi:hypothetical protein
VLVVGDWHDDALIDVPSIFACVKVDSKSWHDA